MELNRNYIFEGALDFEILQFLQRDGRMPFTEIAKALGITDRGQERPSYRDMLGSPRTKNPAAVY